MNNAVTTQPGSPVRKVGEHHIWVPEDKLDVWRAEHDGEVA